MHVHDCCSKCRSSDLLVVPATPADHSHIVVGERVMQTVAITRYVCTDCGFVEEWVNNRLDLQRLKQEHRRRDVVGPSS